MPANSDFRFLILSIPSDPPWNTDPVCPNAVPPPFEIVTERACANDPQAVLLPDVVNFNDSAH